MYYHLKAIQFNFAVDVQPEYVANKTNIPFEFSQFELQSNELRLSEAFVLNIWYGTNMRQFKRQMLERKNADGVNWYGRVIDSTFDEIWSCANSLNGTSADGHINNNCAIFNFISWIPMAYIWSFVRFPSQSTPTNYYCTFNTRESSETW